MGMSEWDLRRVRERPGGPEPVIDVHLDPDHWRRAALEEARVGLTSSPKELSPKWLYDDRGSELFDRITRLPEYYPTRREREILTARADEIAILSRADSLVELGSGTSEKTRLLLDALTRRGELALLRAVRRERADAEAGRGGGLARVPGRSRCTAWSATSSTTSIASPRTGGG